MKKPVKYINLNLNDILQPNDEWWWYSPQKFIPLYETHLNFVGQKVMNVGGSNKKFRRPIYKKNMG